MKRYLFALAVGLAPVWLAASPILESRAPERVLPGLERLIEVALSDSDAMRDQALLREAAAGRRTVSDARVLPNLKAGLELREERLISADEGDDDRRARAIYNVTLSQPLYHWGARQAEKRIGRIGFQMDQVDAEVAAQNAVNLARENYLDLVALKQERALRIESLDTKRAALALQRERVGSGRAGANTADALERELQRLELDSERAELAYQQRVYDFASFLNISEDALLASFDAAVPPVEPLASAEIEALAAAIPERLDENDGLVKLRKLAEADEQRLRIARVSLRPKLNAVLGLSQNGLDSDGIRREEQIVYAGLSIDWHIFDGFAAKGERQQALSRLRRDRVAIENLRASLDRSLRVELRSLELAGKALALDEEALARQASDLAVAEDDFRRGQIAQERLDDLRLAQRRSGVAAQRARAAYMMQLCRFASKLGLDPRADGGAQ